ASCLCHNTSRLLGVLLLGEVGGGHVRTLAREGERHRAADAAVRSGDQCHPAGETAVSLVRLLAVIGAGLHLRLGSGVLLALRREGWLRLRLARVLGALLSHCSAPVWWSWERRVHEPLCTSSLAAGSPAWPERCITRRSQVYVRQRTGVADALLDQGTGSWAKNSLFPA